MANHAPLNHADHAALRVRTERSAALGDAVMSCPLFPHEFRRAQVHYPIVFAKDGGTGAFRAVALFGLEAGENLFLRDGADGWDAAYLPAAMRMAPFLIGRGADGGFEAHVDLDHPRVDAGGIGERLFADGGEHAPALDTGIGALGEVADGDQAGAGFCAMLTEMGLLEPFTFEVTLDDGSKGQLAGLYVIAEERLTGLEAEALARLHEAEALGPVFMAVASVSRLEDLVRRRNARLPAR